MKTIYSTIKLRNPADYNIFESGFTKLLSKEGVLSLSNSENASILSVASALASNIISTSLQNLESGEFVGNLTVKDGYMKSSNYEEDVAGWYLGPETAQLPSTSIVGDLESSNYVVGVSGWKLTQDTGILYANAGIFSGSIFGSTITGSVFQTALTGARVVIDTGNNITLYDDSTGGGGTVVGNSAELTFLRTDNSSYGIIQRLRAGKDYDADVVSEIYPKSSLSSRFNYYYIGRSGAEGNTNLNYFDISVNHETSKTKTTSANGSIAFELYRNGVSYPFTPLFITDSRFLYQNDSYSGACSLLIGSGTNGLAGICYDAGGGAINVIAGAFNSGSLSLRGDTDNIFDIGESSYRYKKGWFYTLNCSTFQLSGGSNGQYLKTDGAGNTSWATVSTFSGNLSDLSINAAKNWGGYGISNLGTLIGNTGAVVNLGSSAANSYWNALYVGTIYGPTGSSAITFANDLDINAAVDISSFLSVHDQLYMNNTRIHDVQDPASDQDAATKAWVEANFTPL